MSPLRTILISFYCIFTLSHAWAFEMMDYLNQYNYDLQETKVTNRKKITKKTFQVDMNGKNTNSFHRFKFHLYKHKSKNPRPLIIILPNISTFQVIEKNFSNFLLRNGFNVLQIKHGLTMQTYYEIPSDLNGFLLKQLTGIHHALKYTLKNELPHTTWVGSFGVSLGGILSSYISGMEKRVTKAIIYLGGGNFNEHICASNVGFLVKYRQETKSDLCSINLAIDPIDFSQETKNKSILMYLDKKDQVVPYQSQLDLLESLGRPEHQTLGMGHIASAVFASTKFDEFLHFFQNK